MKYLNKSKLRLKGTSAAILKDISRAKAERKVLIELVLSFTNNWLYCEFAYIINLNMEVLEVFHDAKKKMPDHLFRDGGEKNDTVLIFTSSFTFSKIQGMESEQEFLD